MKQRTKVMLSSLAAIAMSASLAVGATYALFTSDTQVDISVSSGTVSISATPKNLELYSKGVKQDGNTFEVGGTAKIVENVITIERMVPMDSVKFDIVIENYSNVNVQYRTIVKELEDTGLFPALEVSFSGRKTNKAEFEGASSYSDWALITPNDTDPTTAEPVQTVGVTIDFPDGEDQNKYQNTSCKLVVIVEAVQANADVYSGVAKIGGTAYETLEEALAKAQPNDVVELLHPGVYAPFTINTEGVTVKGIVGENKLESTVFNVTGDNMINLYGDGSAVDSLWVEVLEGSKDWRAGAFNIVYNWNIADGLSDDVTITNSRIYGNDKLNFALLCCNNTFTFTNNYVEGFPTAVSSMSDNGVAVNYTIAGNTTNNVDALIDGYWGMANTTGGTNITVTGNVANDETLIRLWDYTYVKGVDTSINAVVTGNTNATLKLTRKENKAVVTTDETNVIYQNIVTLTGFADGTYTVTDENGNEPAMDDSKTFEVKDGTGTLVVTAGAYRLENENNVYDITVEQDGFAVDANNVFGLKYVSDGLYQGIGSLANGYYVSNAAGLQAVNAKMQSQWYDSNLTLLNDIDMEGAAWTGVGLTGKYPVVFDGNNKTISNMPITGKAMFNRTHGNRVMTIQNLTLDNVTVNSTASNAAIIVGEVYNNLTLDNVDVKNSSISGETKVASLVGSVNNGETWAVTATIKNCDLENITVTGNPNDKKEERLAGMVAWVADKFGNDKIVLENNTMKNVTILSNATASEHHALIYISDVSKSSRYGVYHNEDAGVTLENCSYARKSADGVYGNETETVYFISNVEGLKWVANEVNKVAAQAANIFDNATVKLTNDIDLGGMEWTPIGDYAFNRTVFRGTFDGQGYTISNFKITKNTDRTEKAKDCSYGLFGNVSGTIKNLTVDNADIRAYAYVGAMVGRMKEGAQVINCHVTNSKVECTYWQVGGIVGQQNGAGLIKDCSISDTTITGAAAVGGIVGYAMTAAAAGEIRAYENCTISNCQLVQEGSFGASYDGLFGCVYGDSKVGNDAIKVINITVENTTIKGVASDVLYPEE